MDDSLFYTGHGPVQSKSMQYIDTQPFHFDVQPIQMPNTPDLTGLLYQQEPEPEQADKLSDFDKLMQRQFLMSSLTDNQPIQSEPQVKQASDITELPSGTSTVSSKTAPTLKSDDPLDPNNPFLYKNIDMGFTFDHEQGRRDKMHDAYMNGSYALRGPGILDTTWQDYANATGDARYKDWANMNNAQRTDLVRKFMGWYLDPVISKFDLSKLSQRQRNMIADVAWEYGVYSPMVKDAYAAFTSGDPNAFVNLKNNVGYYYNKPRNKQFKNWGLKRWDARLKYLYG